MSDERVQGKFLKSSFVGSKMHNFFGDGVGSFLTHPESHFDRSLNYASAGTQEITMVHVFLSSSLAFHS